MSVPSAEDLRLRLVVIDDELNALAADAFAEKHELNTEADALRRELAKLLQPELDAASDEWAERAGRKGSHSVDEGEKIAQAGLSSPIDN